MTENPFYLLESTILSHILIRSSLLASYSFLFLKSLADTRHAYLCRLPRNFEITQEEAVESLN